MAEVQNLCTTLTILHVGRVIFSGTIDQLGAHAPAAVHALHTSDDSAAIGIAAQRPELKVARAPEGSGLELIGETGAVDAYVIALGRAGIAVRHLEHRARSLESMFLQLTGSAAAREQPGSPPGQGSNDGWKSPVAS
jgi:ABC-2 type transport system ATP-binding protein